MWAEGVPVVDITCIQPECLTPIVYGYLETKVNCANRAIGAIESHLPRGNLISGCNSSQLQVVTAISDHDGRLYLSFKGRPMISI
jgi:hypothetical protein